MTKKAIAQRTILLVEKETKKESKLLIKINEPYLVDERDPGYSPNEEVAACVIEFFGIDFDPITIHGVDSIHALAQASDIDIYLKKLCGQYNLFFLSGDPYFE